MYLSSITQEACGVVTVLENQLHGLEDGDCVTFREVAAARPRSRAHAHR